LAIAQKNDAAHSGEHRDVLVKIALSAMATSVSKEKNSGGLAKA
jgi:hypothetical protein